jgi:hypothetical protein
MDFDTGPDVFQVRRGGTVDYENIPPVAGFKVILGEIGYSIVIPGRVRIVINPYLMTPADHCLGPCHH